MHSSEVQQRHRPWVTAIGLLTSTKTETDRTEYQVKACGTVTGHLSVRWTFMQFNGMMILYPNAARWHFGRGPPTLTAGPITHRQNRKPVGAMSPNL